MVVGRSEAFADGVVLLPDSAGISLVDDGCGDGGEGEGEKDVGSKLDDEGNIGVVLSGDSVPDVAFGRPETLAVGETVDVLILDATRSNVVAAVEAGVVDDTRDAFVNGAVVVLIAFNVGVDT